MKILVHLFYKLFSYGKAERKAASVSVLTGDSAEKRRLYERALEGAAIEQKKILDEYDKKFGYQG